MSADEAETLDDSINDEGEAVNLDPHGYYTREYDRQIIAAEHETSPTPEEQVPDATSEEPREPSNTKKERGRKAKVAAAESVDTPRSRVPVFIAAADLQIPPRDSSPQTSTRRGSCVRQQSAPVFDRAHPGRRSKHSSKRESNNRILDSIASGISSNGSTRSRLADSPRMRIGEDRRRRDHTHPQARGWAHSQSGQDFQGANMRPTFYAPQSSYEGQHPFSQNMGNSGGFPTVQMSGPGYHSPYAPMGTLNTPYQPLQQQQSPQYYTLHGQTQLLPEPSPYQNQYQYPQQQIQQANQTHDQNSLSPTQFATQLRSFDQQNLIYPYTPIAPVPVHTFSPKGVKISPELQNAPTFGMPLLTNEQFDALLGATTEGHCVPAIRGSLDHRLGENHNPASLTNRRYQFQANNPALNFGQSPAVSSPCSASGVLRPAPRSAQQPFQPPATSNPMYNPGPTPISDGSQELRFGLLSGVPNVVTPTASSSSLAPEGDLQMINPSEPDSQQQSPPLTSGETQNNTMSDATINPSEIIHTVNDSLHTTPNIANGMPPPPQATESPPVVDNLPKPPSQESSPVVNNNMRPPRRYTENLQAFVESASTTPENQAPRQRGQSAHETSTSNQQGLSEQSSVLDTRSRSVSLRCNSRRYASSSQKGTSTANSTPRGRVALPASRKRKLNNAGLAESVEQDTSGSELGDGNTQRDDTTGSAVDDGAEDDEEEYDNYYSDEDEYEDGTSNADSIPASDGRTQRPPIFHSSQYNNLPEGSNFGFRKRIQLYANNPGVYDPDRHNPLDRFPNPNGLYSSPSNRDVRSRDFIRDTNKAPEMIDASLLTDAQLAKRGITRAELPPSKRICKRNAGANNPENIRIVNLKEQQDKSFKEISAILNDQRTKEGKDPRLTPTACANRYNRTAPLLFAASGMEFVPLNERKNVVLQQEVQWDASTQGVLVAAVEKVEAMKWEDVKRLFNEETGLSASVATLAGRYIIM